MHTEVHRAIRNLSDHLEVLSDTLGAATSCHHARLTNRCESIRKFIVGVQNAFDGTALRDMHIPSNVEEVQTIVGTSQLEMIVRMEQLFQEQQKMQRPVQRKRQHLRAERRLERTLNIQNVKTRRRLLSTGSAEDKKMKHIVAELHNTTAEALRQTKRLHKVKSTLAGLSTANAEALHQTKQLE